MRQFFSKQTFLGLLIGLIAPWLCLPLVWFLLSLGHETSVEYEYLQFKLFDYSRSRHLSLALISNLLWFYLFLNREKYLISRGMILAMLLYAPYMIYVYFFTESIGTQIGQ